MKQEKKILIVDDDPRNIFALKLTLQSKGYHCISASGAREGLDIASKEPSDIGIVLLDMMMPDMDGYQAIAGLRENENTATLPVIAVTAQAMPGDREKCLNAGALDYVSKPINVDQLLKIITAHIK